MTENNSWLKLYRSLLEWEWYHDQNTKDIFIHCLLKANYQKTKWRGQELDEGTFITSIQSLKNELNGNKHSKNNFTERNIRTALKHLKSTNDITMQTTNKYTIIKIVKWASYQIAENENDKVNDKVKSNQVTSKRQASDKQVTTDKEIKKERKEELKNKKHKYGLYNHVLLTDSEHEKLSTDFKDIADRIQRLDEYIEMTGKNYKNHNLVIRNWAKKDTAQSKPENKHDVKIDWLDDYTNNL